jgi:hypothetical protein
LQGKKAMAKTHSRTVSSLIRLIGFLFLWAISFGVDCVKSAQPAEADASKEHLNISCAPERPVVHPGETVAVESWVTDAAGRPLTQTPHFTWLVSSGRVSGTDTAIWILDNPKLDSHGVSRETAKVTVQDRHGQGECQVQVFVAKRPDIQPAPDRSTRMSGRALLLPASSEPKGYGLYSYLLFDTPPKDDLERERYLKALESYLLVLQSIEELERHRRRSELNITLIPVKRNVEFPDDLSGPKQASQAAEQVLAAYDYARASALLADLGKQMVQSGPFLVSLRPTESDPGTLFLLFDMSRVTPKLVWDWVKAFCSLAAQERSWSEIELKRLALNTRNVIAVAAKTTPEVLGSLQQWIQIVKTHEGQ